MGPSAHANAWIATSPVIRRGGFFLPPFGGQSRIDESQRAAEGKGVSLWTRLVVRDPRFPRPGDE